MLLNHQSVLRPLARTGLSVAHWNGRKKILSGSRSKSRKIPFNCDRQNYRQNPNSFLRLIPKQIQAEFAGPKDSCDLRPLLPVGTFFCKQAAFCGASLTVFA